MIRNLFFASTYAEVISYYNMWGWGYNGNGQIGDNTTTHRSSPVQNISNNSNWIQLNAGRDHSAGIKSDGTLWTWGKNDVGQLGNNTSSSSTYKSSPVQTIAGGTNWSYVAAAHGNTSGIKSDGTLWTWGDNSQGQIGDNNRVNKSSPVQTIAGGTNWKQVSIGGNHLACVKTDGTLWLWGYNNMGQLGDNSLASRSSPVQVANGGTNWKQVACGMSHTIAIKTDGTLWVWGRNNYGQLGQGNVSSYTTPAQLGSDSWDQVACGNWHTMAVRSDGTLWGWGYNNTAQLGNGLYGTFSKYSSPVQTIAGGTNWKQVSCGNGHSAAIKTDGTLWDWGTNGFGELATGGTDQKSSPVQTIAGGTNWKSVSCGWSHTLTLK